MRFADKVVVVTGASRGIGRAIALQFGQEGASVVVNYSHSREQAEAVVVAIEAAGGQAIAIGADVSDPAQVTALFAATLERFGRVDVLVNNAGITRDKLFIKMELEDWDAVLDTNLRGPFLCCKVVIPAMSKQRSGAIINVGSVVGKSGNAGQTNYSASKAGLFGFTKSLAKEYGKRNIRINAVAPGFIETEMTDGLKPEYRDELLKTIPLNRFGSPEDVARVVAFLASADAAYIQGEVIAIDGGLSM